MSFSLSEFNLLYILFSTFCAVFVCVDLDIYESMCLRVIFV